MNVRNGIGTLLAFGVTAALLATGCGAERGGRLGTTPAPARADTVYSLADEIEVQLDRFSDAIATAKEEATVEQARRAKQVATEAAVEIQAIARRLERLEIPPDEVKRKITEQGRAREQAMRDRLGSRSEFTEGLEPEVAAILRETMQSFRREVREAGAIFDRYFEVQR